MIRLGLLLASVRSVSLAQSLRVRQNQSLCFCLGLCLSLSLSLSLSLNSQAQERLEFWFESQNYLSRQVARSDTSLSERQAENFYEDRVYQLHGELVMPLTADAANNPAPAIVFLVGSGPNSSHQSLYADFVRENLEALFLNHGIALLYFDKRGIGLSEGRWHRTDLFERADDARSAVRALSQHPGIDGNRIGVVGHSQGGTVAQLLGAMYGDSLAFVASLAAPTYDTERRLTHEYYSRFLCEGDPEAEAMDRAQKKAISDLNWVNAFPLTKAWRHLSELSDFDPAPYLAQLSLPAYFAFPEEDYFVSADWAMEALRLARPSSTSPDFAEHLTVQSFPGLDHDFRPTDNLCTGSGVEISFEKDDKQKDDEQKEVAKSKYTEASTPVPDFSEDFQQAFQAWVLAVFGLN